MFFPVIFISKMNVKMNLRIKRKNDVADPGIGFLTKSISLPFRLRSLSFFSERWSKIIFTYRAPSFAGISIGFFLRFIYSVSF